MNEAANRAAGPVFQCGPHRAAVKAGRASQADPTGFFAPVG